MPARELPLDEGGILARFDSLFERVEELRADVANLTAEVGTVPPAGERGERKTVTERLHGLEAQTSPAAIEASMIRALRHLGGSLLTKGQKLALFAFAFVAAIDTILRIVGWHG